MGRLPILPTEIPSIHVKHDKIWHTFQKSQAFPLLVHKDDIKQSELPKVTNCLIPPTPPTTPANTGITTTTRKTTATKISGTRAQWRFGTRKQMGGFLDKITPFPPGARANIGGG